MDELKTELRDLRAETDRLRRAFTRRTIALTATAVAVAIAVIIVSALALRVQAENDRRIDANNANWCPLVQALVLQPGDPKPTARGVRLIDWAADMRRKFHCPTQEGTG